MSTNKIIKFVESQGEAKGELASANIEEQGVTCDCAIPQMWLDKVSQRFPNDQLESFGNLASHFVYVYDNNDRTEYLMPLTKVGCKILGTLSLYA